MDSGKEILSELSANAIGLFVVFAHIGSIPLAVVFGDKWDVLLSLIVPTYGFWVMLGQLL